jgi:RNA polymerase sigma-70 factor (ECF subfamily)
MSDDSKVSKFLLSTGNIASPHTSKEQMVRDRTELHKGLAPLAPQIRRFAYALTRNAADADDLAQATVERVLSRPIPEDAELAKWMFRVCRNIWIDEMRARKVRREAAPDLVASDEDASTEERVAAQLALKRAQAGIDALPQEQREVLAMVAIAGMAYREAADALSIPIGTVMSRLARARAALAAHMEAAT